MYHKSPPAGGFCRGFMRVSDDLPVQHQQVFARGLLGDACAQFADEMLAFGLDFVLAFFYMAAQFADALPRVAVMPPGAAPSVKTIAP